MVGYNENFESYVSAGSTYNTFYIRFNEYDKAAYQWGDYIQEDSTVILAVPVKTSNDLTAGFEAILVAALGAVVDQGIPCITTTTTTSSAPASTTTTTSTNIP
jgi:hypothetical protein